MNTQRSEYDMNFNKCYNSLSLMKSNKAEFYNNPRTKPVTRSAFDVKYNKEYNKLSLDHGNMAEFYCSSCRTPDNFSELKHAWTPGYYGKGMYNENGNMNYNENVMTGDIVSAMGYTEHFNPTPANTRLTTEDPENIYSYPQFLTPCGKSINLK